MLCFHISEHLPSEHGMEYELSCPLTQVAEEMREHMAEMGFRTVDEMVGRADMLEMDTNVINSNDKLSGIDLSKILLPAAELRPDAAQHCVQKQEHKLHEGLDTELISRCEPVLGGWDATHPVYFEHEIKNTHRY